ncbi:unnamed protein product [Psylliodes chrysocephalus]|uniref:Uncharacterized protein n=1 Tax=Psylliodes chrysocephalus TaxID=3402493 RepID=A0A9P0D2T6_9CUCU|nr:unnamed protein product [Psylliodes chrysocephala]
MIWNDDVYIEYENAKKCHICNKVFENDDDQKVRDHNHITREYRGAACNLNLPLPKFISIEIHNLRYDSMIFLRWILELSENYSDINIIPNSKENYITFSKKVIFDKYEQPYDYYRCNKCNKKPIYNKIIEKCGTCGNKMVLKRKGEIQNVRVEFKFIDTFSTSLDKAVNKLTDVNNCYYVKCNSKQEIINAKFLPINENNVLKLIANCKKCDSKVSKPVEYTKFKNIMTEFNKEDLHMVLRKGVYSYEWVDNYQKFYDERDWYSTLNDNLIKNADLNFTKEVYNHFECKNFGDYHI